MRKIIVLTFLTLDGVMQAPGGPTEDTSGNFTHGGWTVPYFDEVLGQVMTEQMSVPFDLLLGRKTFEIFASYWPDHPEEGPGINQATKYVASNTLTTHPWEKTVFLRGNVGRDVQKLKQAMARICRCMAAAASFRRCSSRTWWMNSGSRYSQ
jgi:dihydrofolate reductase